jgi:hypothetical protein
MDLEVALSEKEINCARRIYDRIPQMKQADAALKKLREKMPGFSIEECLLKAVAINSLYGTQILAIVQMGRHIADIFIDPHKPEGVGLVERIAKLPGKRNFISFASKFCHFFVDKEENYPLYDEVTRETMKLHLGRKNYLANGQHPYRAFYENFFRLRNLVGPKCGTRDLDYYLWITGMYMRWLRERGNEKPRVSLDLRQIFEKPTKTQINELDILLPPTLDREFKGNL